MGERAANIIDDLVADYDGELPFWNAWVMGDVSPRVKQAFRAEAKSRPALQADLESIERKKGARFTTEHAQAYLRNALEAVVYLTDKPAPWDLEGVPDITEVAFTPTDEAEAALAAWVRSAVFPLWSELDLPEPRPEDESRFGSEVYRALVSGPQINRFLELDNWLIDIREWCMEANPRALERLLRWLAPKLFEASHQSPHQFQYRLSYRLMLRATLKHYCRRNGIRPTGRKHPDLEIAFDRLSFERMGVLLKQVFDSPPALASAQEEIRCLASSRLVGPLP
jgi:hypothetical protein